MAKYRKCAPSALLCTVGTSLFHPNLEQRLDAQAHKELAEAYGRRDMERVAEGLAAFDATDPLCGAEINSVAFLLRSGRFPEGGRLVFLHSDTDDGRQIAQILVHYYKNAGFPQSEARQVTDLRDDPRLFRTRGLRNLAKELCRAAREFGPAACLINATGGYKAQIAVAVILGVAMRIPVFYKHERFDDIISFPPMPIALDYGLWMKTSGLLTALGRPNDAVRAAEIDELSEDAETLEPLIERVDMDGVEYVELSPVGQIFLDAFKDRFRSEKDQFLPPNTPPGQKKQPRWEVSGHIRAHPEIMRTMERVTAEVGPVVACSTFYFNPDLSQPSRFRVSAHGIEGVVSDRTYCAKFRVDTTATTEGQTSAVCALLNEWLDRR